MTWKRTRAISVLQTVALLRRSEHCKSPSTSFGVVFLQVSKRDHTWVVESPLGSRPSISQGSVACLVFEAMAYCVVVLRTELLSDHVERRSQAEADTVQYCVLGQVRHKTSCDSVDGSQSTCAPAWQRFVWTFVIQPGGRFTKAKPSASEHQRPKAH